jgi:hypothetical protein
MPNNGTAASERSDDSQYSEQGQKCQNILRPKRPENSSPEKVSVCAAAQRCRAD